ncbi:MAG: hypothetical protein OSB68_04520 [Dehalococcoidia bacterium]|nr:hypothetical protein [Dehalococcoidia bacterium]
MSTQEFSGNASWGSRLTIKYEGTIHAPQFPEGLEWCNTKAPLTLEDLRGRLVILHFWTYC